MLSRRQLMNDKIVSAQGENLSLVNVKGSKLNALSVYGKSTQDGTPSPENPVPIVSAGSVMTTGAQLLDINSGTISGSNIENITNTLTSGETYTYTNIDSPVPTIIGGRNANGDYIPFDNGVYASDGNGFTFSMPDNVAYLILGGSGGLIDKSMKFMLNSGSTALPWEPYTGGVPGVNPYEGEINVSVSDGGTQSQTLTLSTPGGLPGIPVDSGGNYTDENGQQWVCDEIDLARGKLIKRVGKTVVDGANIKFEADSAGSFWNLPRYSSPGIKYDASIQSTYFPFTVFNENKPYEFIWTSPNLMSSYFSTVNELNQFCTEMNDMGQPVTLYYTLDTPIETDLPAEEIAAYKALHTYTPNTSVGNDAEAWMQVGYREWRR